MLNLPVVTLSAIMRCEWTRLPEPNVTSAPDVDVRSLATDFSPAAVTACDHGPAGRACWGPGWPELEPSSDQCLTTRLARPVL